MPFAALSIVPESVSASSFQTRTSGTLTTVTAVKDFRKTWHNCCCAAGVGKMVCVKCGTEECDCPKEGRETKYVGLCFHDLRRTFARNGRRDGG